MMTYQMIQTKIKEALAGRRMKYTLVLLACTLISSLIALLPSILMAFTGSSLLLVAGLFFAMVAIVMQNTIYYMFLKLIRKEPFQKSDITYSLSKIGLHILTYLLIVLAQYGIDAILTIVLGNIPVVYRIVSMLLSVFILAVKIFIAFAILDGVRGAMQIVKGSFAIMMQYCKHTFTFAMPYLIWMSVCEIAVNTLMTSILQSHNLAIDTTILELIESPALVDMMLMMLGASLLQSIGNSICMVNMLLAYGVLYEEDYCRFYPLQEQVGHGNVIDIDPEL